MSAQPAAAPATRWAPLRRAAALVHPRRRRLALSILLGAGAILAAVALLSVAGVLISKAALRPEILSLTVWTVSVRALAITRAVLRYLERLVSHDLAFRVLADLRVRFFKRLSPLVPEGLAGLRGGDVLSRFVADVDTLQDLYLRALGPPLIAGVVIVAVGVAMAIVLPVGAVVLVVRARRRRSWSCLRWRAPRPAPPAGARPPRAQSSPPSWSRWCRARRSSPSPAARTTGPPACSPPTPA